MEKGQVAMSVGYAFYGRGLAPDRPLESLEGPAEIVEALRKKLDARTPAARAETTLVARRRAGGHR